ncbi:MAG: ATP-dependent RNA helicase HrpA [Pseudomonadota bacterium]
MEQLANSIYFPDDLPVSQKRLEIAELIAAHQVVIVAGETGSGKTTQLPKICLSIGRGEYKQIGHTQPRRLAARTVAQRIAQELGSELGDTVGYQVRFTDKVSDSTAIKLMTDGILLAEIQHDRLLKRYDTLIIDEAHERSLNIDFILGYLKRILPKRPDLKLIITSATIDVESFSKHFDDAPVVEVSGRTFPVETHYLDPLDNDLEESNSEHIVQLVEDIEAGVYGDRGDVLIFLPGERDIRELAKKLRSNDALTVLPLYARLSQREQNRVFDTVTKSGIRVVLATNVAETSITVPGIRYVIDPGLARISRYSFRTKLQRLPIERISQASANQRQGRCGRVASGVCLRLYSEEDFLQRPEYTDPEILRTNLAAVVLRMLSLGLGSVADFPFINPPDPRQIRDGYKLLEELGAINAGGKLSSIGRRMAQLPVDPRLARMILAAAELKCMEEVLIIASALAIADPKERPADKQQQADQHHARFRHARSDFMAWLNLWNYYEQQRQSLGSNQLRKLCKREFLSFMRMREWRDVHTQLTIACRGQRYRWIQAIPEEENYEAVHRALLAGLLSNIAQRQEGKDYLGSRNRKLRVFPGSSQARKPPKWLVAAEIVETSGVFAREVGAIEPHWVLSINPQLLKHHYYQPRWHARSGRVMAYERISLYGLVLADKRSIHYGPIAPIESRELLIREGLIAGQIRPQPTFLQQNLKLIKGIQDIESRVRRRDVLAEEEVLFAFYAARLPEKLYTAGQLRSYLKRSAKNEKCLLMKREQVITREPGFLTDQFPDTLLWDDMKLRLSYQFEPGGASDGVSVTVPVALLNRVPRFRFDWLVPGLLREKCIQLVKALPKAQRRLLVPVPDHVDRALAVMQPADEDLCTVLAAVLTRGSRCRLVASDFATEKLDDFYRMNIRVVDSEGALLEQSRDLAGLIDRFRSDTSDIIAAEAQGSPARANITRWDFDEIPQQWRFRQAEMDIVSYPALIDETNHVAITLCDYPGEALIQHRLGVLRLYRLHSAQQVKYLRKQLLRGNDFALVLAACQLAKDPLVHDVIDASYMLAMSVDLAPPYSKLEFEQALYRGKGQVIERANELEKMLFSSLQVLSDVRSRLSDIPESLGSDAVRDITAQVSRLWQSGFMRDTPEQWLLQLPRYMKAIRIRLERLSGQYAKDQRNIETLQELEAPLWQAMAERPGLLQLSKEAQVYRWLLEEFRVSLFAQSLGTTQPVSAKRLTERWRAVSKWLLENPH